MTKPYALQSLPWIQDVLAQAPAGLITDIDGTIAPIAPTPQQAQVSPTCRASLAALASRVAVVAALSGREVVRAREIVAVDTMTYIGNHGLERWQDGRVEIADDAKEYTDAIRVTVERLRQDSITTGLIIEDKGVTIGIHYRLAPNHRQTRDAILRFLGDIPATSGLMITEGKLLVEIRPSVKIDKGTSLKQMVQENSLKGVICLGDDTTDVDAFRALHALSSQGICQGLAVGVLGKDTPPEVEQEADLVLRGVPEVEELLKILSET
jgi:trehalose 6-phosphate phosphatase